MKASFVIPADGLYAVIVANKDEDTGAPPFPMQVYRNRVRLTATTSLHEIRWRGRCEKDDLIEADGERDVSLTVVEDVTQPGAINRTYAHAQNADDRIAPV